MADVVERLRSRLRRIIAVGVAVVAVVGVAGTFFVAAQPSWAILIYSCVVAASMVVILAVGAGAGSEIRSHTVLVDHPEPVESAHSTFGDDTDRRREVFGKLAYRLQSLISRAIQRVDGLEREIEDPDLLRGLYDIDHLATRVRRQAENLAVLGGGRPQRRSNSPVSVYAVMRSAVAEIEHYKQVTIVPYSGVNLHGHVVAEVIHLLAELCENATSFTAPDAPKVVLRAHKVTAGLAIEIQDRGLGMTVEDLERTNRFLDGSAEIDLADLLSDGRIGLGVVKELSGRHGARVQLQANIFGGIDASVVLPHSLLAEPQTDPGISRFAGPVPQEARPDRPSAPAADPLPSPRPVPAMSPPPTGRFAPNVESPGSSSSVGSDADRAPASPSNPSSQPFRAAVVPDPADSAAPPPLTDPTGIPNPAPEHRRPPLPQRGDHGSYLRPELQDPPQLTRPVPGHDSNLLATVQKGFERVRGEAADAEPSETRPGITRGESTAWPTT